MLEYLGLDVCYVFAARLSAGAHRSRHIPYAPVIETPADKVAWFWFCWTPRGLEAFVSSYWCRDDIKPKAPFAADLPNRATSNCCTCSRTLARYASRSR